MTEPMLAAGQPISRFAGGPSSLRDLFRQSLEYMAGGLAYKAVALLAVPFLARLLTPAELGLLDLAAVIASIVGLSIGLGTENAVARLEPAEQDEGRLWGSALGLIATVGLAGFGAGILVREPLAALLLGDPGRGSLLMAAVGYGAALAAATTALNAVRLRRGARRYAIFGFLIVTAEMGVAIAIALLLEDPVVPMVLAWVVASATGASVIAVTHLPRLRAPSASVIRQLLAFGVPMVPATLAWLLGDVAIRVAIAQAGELSVLGQYGIAFRIASVMSLAIAGFGLAWHPFLYRADLPRALEHARHAIVKLLAGIGLTAVALSAVAPELVSLVAGPGYEGAATAIPLLAGAMLAFGQFTLFSAVAGIRYRTRLVGAGAVSGGLVQLLLAWLLIADHGIVGAGVAVLAGHVTAAAILVTEARGLTLCAREVATGAVTLVVVAATLTGLVIAGREAEWFVRLAIAAPAPLVLIPLLNRRVTREAGDQ